MVDKDYFANLRKEAEKLLHRQKEKPREDTKVEVLRLLHELEVHQVELELQNEELRRVQVDLENSQHEYLSLYNAAPAGFMSIDARGVITRANQKAEDMFLDISHMLTGKNILRLIHPQDHPIYLRLLDRTGIHNGGFCELRMTEKSGDLMHVRMEASARLDANGALQRDLVISDMTHQKNAEKALQELNESLTLQVAEREEAEQELRESERRYREMYEEMRALFAVMTDLVFILDAEGRYLKIIETSPALLYKPSNELLGKTLHEVFPTEQADFFLGHLTQTLNQKQTIEIEYSMSIGDQEHWFNATFSPIFDDKIMVVARDITERKKAEKTLAHLNQYLEEKVRERTAIAETRAIQLRSLAIELIETEERERRSFAHLLHDDLQQMLAAAKMRLQSISSSMSDERPFVEIQQLLKASIEKSRRLSHELSPPVLQHTGLIGVLQWLGRRMGEQFDLKVDLEVESEPPGENATLKRFLFRSVQELLFNTVKHAGVSRARIVLSGSESEIKVCVIDEGKGFEPGILKKIERGFGVMTIQERASYMGGSLEIDSAPGKGSRFTITVPPGPTTEAPTPPEMLATLQTIPTSGVPAAGITRVLFADDHHIMRKGLVNLVRGHPNIEVVGEAANGLEALERSLQLRPNVVVMDISMPVMDGIEATRRIKAELPEVRVIGLSMHIDEQTAISMRNAGAETYIAKTASPKKLIEAICGAPQARRP